MAEKNDRSLMMGANRFANEVREGYDANLRYCFILGAGASVASGIPLARQLMAEWREYLLQYSGKEMRRIAAYVGLDYDDKVAPLLADGYVPRSDDYFTFYDLRFAGMPVQAYAYLQGLMDKAKPSFGYYALAVLLEDFQNKLVVTTNFDSLVEETLSLMHAQRPLVVGHESLAPFLGSTENRNRATIVKVHHDLLMHPKNGEDEVSGLDASLEGSLRKALSGCVPIVVGYAGADQSLMSLLEDMRFDAMYWCVMESSEVQVDERVRRLLRERVTDGHLVHIKGFDQAMYLLLDRFVVDRSDEEFKRPNTRIREYMQGRLDDYVEQLKAVTESLAVPKGGGIATLDVIDMKEAARERSMSAIDSNVAPTDDGGTVPLGTLERLSDADGQADTDGSTSRKDTEKANLAFVRGVQAYNEGNYNEALAQFNEAVRLVPESDAFHAMRSIILCDMGHHEEALIDSGEALRLVPSRANYHAMQGVILRDMGRYDEALAQFDEAVRLEPENASYHQQRGATLRVMGRYDEALSESDEAVRLEPQKALYHQQHGVTLCKLGRMEESLEAIDRAIELDPCYARAHESRALTLREMGREEEALAEEAKARELSEM